MSAMIHKGVYVFRGTCQTKGFPISVLLDGGERPLSKMLKEYKHKKLTHRIHNETHILFVSHQRQMPDQTAHHFCSV